MYVDYVLWILLAEICLILTTCVFFFLTYPELSQFHNPDNNWSWKCHAKFHTKWRHIIYMEGTSMFTYFLYNSTVFFNQCAKKPLGIQYSLNCQVSVFLSWSLNLKFAENTLRHSVMKSASLQPRCIGPFPAARVRLALIAVCQHRARGRSCGHESPAVWRVCQLTCLELSDVLKHSQRLGLFSTLMNAVGFCG